MNVRGWRTARRYGRSWDVGEKKPDTLFGVDHEEAAAILKRAREIKEHMAANPMPLQVPPSIYHDLHAQVDVAMGYEFSAACPVCGWEPDDG